MPTALALARKLAALPEPRMREHSLVEFLGRSDPAQAAAILAEIHSKGKSGGPPFSVALRTVFSVLSRDALGYELQSALYEAAKDGGHEAVMFLLYTSSAAEQPQAERAQQQHELTLGHRKSLARSRDPDVLDKLFANPEPEVVRNLLANPRVTEDDVVRLAAQRPADPAVQREISASGPWIRRYRVRRALVLNPHTPLDIGIRLLGFLNVGDLKLVRTSPTLATPLRRAADRIAGEGF
jgi:hypothetical protein